jgi:hypothetical protein
VGAIPKSVRGDGVPTKNPGDHGVDPSVLYPTDRPSLTEESA